MDTYELPLSSRRNAFIRRWPLSPDRLAAGRSRRRAFALPATLLCVVAIAVVTFVAAVAPAAAGPVYSFGAGEVGPTGPLFSGPQQQPFLCETEESGLGRPLVDNDEGIGMAVHDDDGKLLGYSRYCGAPTQIRYVYRSTDGTFKELPDRATRPRDLAQTMTSEGLYVDYIVRIELGTINRFIYGIAMLAPYDGPRHNPHIPQPWNGKLLYYFGGGVGVGHRQGRFRVDDLLRDELLKEGWAVVHSTGNVTDNHYNLVLAGETAMMVKDHFIARYGEPKYTVGAGASGGAIQQYVIAQNHPGLLDGLVPVDSYPDMITQTMYAGDCALMEYVFDTSSDRRWRDPVAREGFEGLAGNREIDSTACAESWSQLAPLAMNPSVQKPELLARLRRHFPLRLVSTTKYTYWNDLRNIFGVDHAGVAPSTWDNVGVQYGLKSLQDGTITKSDFFLMNELIGGWKQPGEMRGSSAPYDVDNQRRGALGHPNRTEGDVGSMQRAYLAGQVFTGHPELPIIDARHYKDPLLDMHHFLQSFATRERIKRVHGHADHHVMWVADAEAPLPLPSMAVAAMDEWLSNLHANPELSIAEARPARVVDSCWAYDGSLIASGAGVWDGDLMASGAAGPGDGLGGLFGLVGFGAGGRDHRGAGAFGAIGGRSDSTAGPCRTEFPPYENSRTLAGAPVAGDVFKCQLMSVDEAISRGMYPTSGPNTFRLADYNKLYELFPDGVCDYDLPDAGLPPNWGW